MKKRIVIVALIGVSVGVCWVTILGAIFHLYSPLHAPWNAIMLASCPPLWAFRATWWLAPILNGLFYAAIAVTIQFFRKFLSPFAG